MDFFWNELRRTMIEAKKSLAAAPYIMYMIERVTKVTFQKTCKHEPLHIHARSGDAPPLPPLHAGATRNPRLDPAPSSLGVSSSSRHGHHNSFVKRALRSLFVMCRNIAHDVHENTRSINEIGGHLGLPLNAHRDFQSLMIHLLSGTLPMRPLSMLPMLHFLMLVVKLVLLVAALLLLLLVHLLLAKRSLMKMRRPKKKSPSTTASTPTLMKMRPPPRTPLMLMMSRRPCR